MLEALEMKTMKLESEKQIEQREIKKYMDYMKEKDVQANQLQEQKDESSKQREEIFQKLKAEQERKA